VKAMIRVLPCLCNSNRTSCLLSCGYTGSASDIVDGPHGSAEYAASYSSQGGILDLLQSGHLIAGKLYHWESIVND
jgi:hypothetical protein